MKPLSLLKKEKNKLYRLINLRKDYYKIMKIIISLNENCYKPRGIQLEILKKFKNRDSSEKNI